PAGPRAAEQVETIKQGTAEGAEWPDDVSGAAPEPPADPDAARLMAAIRGGDRASIDAILHATPQAAKARGAHGTTPLMTAALYGDAALVKRLLAAGADANAPNRAGPTALVWAVPDRDTMSLLLDAGADVHARSDDGRTALIVASGIVGGAPALRLLLDYGANPFAAGASDVSPLREAARVDDVDLFRLLVEY